MSEPPRLDIRERCWLCSKPILVGQATRWLARAGGFEVHARCYENEERGLAEPPKE